MSETRARANARLLDCSGGKCVQQTGGSCRRPLRAGQQVRLIAVSERFAHRFSGLRSMRRRALDSDSDSLTHFAFSSVKPVINWDELGFGLTPTAAMYIATCVRGEEVRR